MILIVGLIALVLGLLLGIYVLWIIGLVLLLVGLLLFFIPVGGRTHRWY